MISDAIMSKQQPVEAPVLCFSHAVVLDFRVGYSKKRHNVHVYFDVVADAATTSSKGDLSTSTGFR